MKTLAGGAYRGRA